MAGDPMGRKSKTVTHEKACELVLAGIDFNYLLYRKTKFNQVEKERIRQTLRAEEELFRVYLKTGKHTLESFPFDMLDATNYEKVETIQYLVHLLFNAGWTPEFHVTKTRLKFKDTELIPYTNTLKNGRKVLVVPN